MPPKNASSVPPTFSRFHNMLAAWLGADSTLDYDSTTKLSALWMEWKYGAPYDNYAINKLIETINTFYGTCLDQEHIEIAFDEFVKGGDLQSTSDLSDRLLNCD
jgi:hypothetical protein